jgi:uncharacterized SAM-binding protein YcdF (DUF218 family)
MMEAGHIMLPPDSRNSDLESGPMGQNSAAATGLEAGRFAVSKRRRSLAWRIVRGVGFSAFAVALLFATGFGWFANHVSTLATPRNPSAADAIIVLTGGQSRLDAGLELLKSGKGKRLLISGVHPDADLDDLQAVTGADKSLFRCCVDIDHAALDTIGNAEESAKWVKGHHYGSILLVTNNYHMPRSLLEMGRLMGEADLKPYPVVNSRLDGGNWMVKPDALRVLFMEYNKYLLALARAVVPLKPVPGGVAVAQVGHVQE